MNEEKYQEFCQRYNKFKKNNLPTPFWDEERQTLEYVYYNNKKELAINSSLSSAIGNIACTGFYYPFTSKHMMAFKENGKIIRKFATKHTHAHFFEDVVKALYDSPESFNISLDEEKFYSKQELKYLKRIQKYLLFIGLKDLETSKFSVNRYHNKIHLKYENAIIHTFSDNLINDTLNNKRNFRIIDWYPEYLGDKIYQPSEFQALVVDINDNFKMFIEYTKREVKLYKDIKHIYIDNNLNDNDKVICQYFKVLKLF